MINKSFRTDDCVDEILRKYSKTVYRVAYLRTKNQADADDVLQEVFMRFIKCNTQFKDEEHVKAWLIRAAINCSKNLMSSA